MGEALPSENLFGKLSRFSSFLETPVVGFENEIISLLRKTDARRGNEGMALGRKMNPKASSRFDREIQKLECSINYNKSPLVARGRGRSIGDQALFQ